MRAFIAIEIEDGVRAALARVQNEAPVTGRGVRWVKPESLHLTLKFLGAVEDARVERVTNAMRAAVAGATTFELAARGVGCFPNPRSPRVLWAGLADEPALLALAERVERECRALGFPAEERPFRSHITLARIAGRVALDPTRLAPDRPVFGSWRVPRVVLMESQLSPRGSRYSVRDEATLEGSP
jgi:2'-5' RNA ligase